MLTVSFGFNHPDFNRLETALAGFFSDPVKIIHSFAFLTQHFKRKHTGILRTPVWFVAYHWIKITIFN